jgi:hypothetical protein
MEPEAVGVRGTAARPALRVLVPWAAVLFAALGTAGVAAPAEEPPLTVDQIVEQANHVAYYQGGTGRARVKMTIYGADGKERGRRELIILRRNTEEGLNQKFYAYFERPADVRGTVFLVWKNCGEDQDDDRWLYSPGLDLVNRIAAGDKRTSFVGTHFFYEDVSGRRITEDTHELTKTTDDYYVVRSTPVDPDLAEFGHYDTYIHRTTFVPLHAYYYDKNGERYREYHVTGWEQVQDFWTVTKAEMVDLREQGTETAKTVVEYSEVRYGVDLPDSTFAERYLRNPPRDYLQ